MAFIILHIISWILIIPCLLNLLILKPGNAQNYQFQRYDTQSGLSNNIIYDVYQDSYGFIWIATENGLNRFDGISFETFYHSPDDTTTISSNHVRSMAEDYNGTLWGGTFNGLNRFDRKTSTFKRYTGLMESENYRMDIQDIITDKNGNLWFTQPKAIFCFNVVTESFKIVPNGNSENQVFLDSKDRIWVYNYNDKGQKLSYLKEDEFVDYYLNTFRSGYPIHFGSYSHKLWVKGEIDKEFPFKKTGQIPDLPNGIHPARLLEDRSQNLWMGSNHGLYLYQPNSGSLNRVDLGSKSDALGSAVRNLFEDRWGGIWVATLNGLYYHDPNHKAFQFRDISTDDVENKGAAISAIYETDDTLWIGTLGKGIIKLFTSSNRSSQLLPGDDSGSKQVWDIFRHPADKHTKWIATTAGLFKYGKSNKTIRIPLPKNDKAAPVVFSIIEAGASAIWAAGDEDVYHLDIKSEAVLNRISFSHLDNLSTLQSLLFVQNRYLLIGSEGLGLFIYDVLAKKLFPLSDVNQQASLLANTSIWTMYQDRNQQIWLGTGSGLFKMSPDFLTLEHFPDEHTSSIIYSILEDENGYLWTGTDRGLMLFKPEEKTFFYFDVQDGIGNTEFNRRAALKASDGIFWFGGIQGLTVFKPGEVKPNPHEPIVHITSAEIFTSGEIATMNLTGSNSLSLAWPDNTFEINFTALNFTNPGRNQYRYRLKEFESDWVSSNQQRFARYANIPAGKYIFELQASNNDGIWNTEEARLHIAIAPPFWQTNGFRAVVVLLLAGLVWLLYKYRVHKIIEMERMRIRIASDLHDEIGSGLSSIALTSDLIEKEADNQISKSDLVSKIRNSARELSSSLDSIIWLIDPKKETLAELIEKMQTTTAIMLQGKKIDFKTGIEHALESSVLPPLFRRNIFLFYKEAVHNIVKHADAGHITISVTASQQRLVIDIRDDGVGFKESGASNGYGLKTMQTRANEINAKFQIRSNPGSGTQIRLEGRIP